MNFDYSAPHSNGAGFAFGRNIIAVFAITLVKNVLKISGTEPVEVPLRPVRQAHRPLIIIRYFVAGVLIVSTRRTDNV